MSKPSGSDFDVLYVPSQVLYCSYECAHRDGRDTNYCILIYEKDFRTAEFGALCPVCGNEYHNF